MKSQIQNKEEVLVCGISNTNTIYSYLFCWNYEQSSQNNQCTWCSPLRYEDIFSKKRFSGGEKLIWAKYLWGGCSK